MIKIGKMLATDAILSFLTPPEIAILSTVSRGLQTLIKQKKALITSIYTSGLPSSSRLRFWRHFANYELY
jgi:hypothetical protein